MKRLPALTVVSAECLPVRLDFRISVVHSLASRDFTVNVCTILKSDSGFTGYGECVPRSYVTGETPESVVNALKKMLPQISGKSISSPLEMLALLMSIQKSETGTSNPSAMCALELALFDLAGKYWDVPVSDFLRLDRSNDPLIYSLIVPLLPDDAFKKLLERAKTYQFPHVKLKVDTNDPVSRVRRAREILGTDIELRVDVNCCWNREDAKVYCCEMADLGVVSVGQPLPADDLKGMAELRRLCPMPIMLDESVKNPEDVENAVSIGACDSINVRISKCGGLLGAKRVIETALDNGLEIQLGAQVGESCILSAAGVCLAAGIPLFRWLEGFFGTHLLMKDLCKADIRFGHGGRLNPPIGPGLGVTVDPDHIAEAHALYKTYLNSGSSISPAD